MLLLIEQKFCFLMSSICNQYVVIDDYSRENEAVIVLSVNVTALLMIDI